MNRLIKIILRPLLASALFLAAFQAFAVPTVSITAPTASQKFGVPATVTIIATATPSSGTTITKVDFFRGGTTLIGTAMAPPYSIVWSNPATGSYSLTAKATDSAGGTKTSTAVAIVVQTNVVPTVSITAPTAAQKFGVPVNITLTATASDTDGTISKVDFFRGGTTLIGTATTSPYSIVWSGPATGSYSLTAKAADNSGGTKTSTAVAITVETNVVPTVSISSPANNASFSAGAPVTINATATDSDGTISQVEFFSGTTSLGVDTTSPFTVTFTPATPGTYSLTAKATDNSGGSKTSSPAISIIAKANVLPTVNITSPTTTNPPTAFGAGAPITINATATDSDGTIKQVEFFSGATSLGVDLVTPFSATFTPATPGNYSLTAKATDNAGGISTSQAVSITALVPPTVAITAPANNASFAPGATISLTATATAAPVTGVSISKVEFFNGATSLGSKAAPPYTVSWPNVAAGTYTITARATDNKMGTNVSAPITVTVAVPHTPPTVSITAPTSGAVSQGPAAITISATASAAAGSTISYVEFFNGSSSLGKVFSPGPYTVNWPNVSSGGYLLKAIATDSSNVSTTSSLVYAIVDGADSCTTSPPISAAESATMLAAFGKLPLAFEENVGQSDARVKFLGRGPGYQLFLTGDSSVLALRSNEGQQAAVRMSFADGESAAVTGADRQASVVNYFVGSNPAWWHSNVATFAKVRYSSIYPGIDAVYHATQGKLEYDLVAEPRADVSRIRLAFDGVEGLSLDENGSLLLRTVVGSIAQWKPIAYQEIDGARKEVSASYRLIGNRVAFELGAYDRDQTLIIDPVLVYSTYLGGSDSSSGAYAIALSRCGEAFVSGWTWATTFPTTTGAFDTGGDPSSSMGFVSKLNQSGTGLLYSTFVTGITYNHSNWTAQVTDLMSIAVDSTGHAYVAGNTNSSDFPVTPGALVTVAPSDQSSVLAKLNTDGSALIYATYTNLATTVGVAVDSSGSAYITGGRNVSKIAANGASVVYSFTAGGTGGAGGTDSTSAIAVDASGNAYVTGITHSNVTGTLPVTTGAFETTWPATSTSSTSGFVQKINPAGNALIYGTYFGSKGTVQPTSIAVDSLGRAFIGGFSDGLGFPVALGASFNSNPDGDRTGIVYAFASRLSPDGTHGDFFTWVGGQSCSTPTSCFVSTTRANGIAVDSSSNVWIAGITGSNRIPLTKPLYSTFGAPDGDNFVVKLDPTGTTMLFATLLNGATQASAALIGRSDSTLSGIQVDSIGSAYVAGWTRTSDFPTTTGAYQTAPQPSSSPKAFITKINESKDTTTALVVSPNPGIVGGTETLTATVAGNAPTGSISFLDGSTSIGSVPMSGTTAQLVTSSLAGGLHNLSAAYAGDAHNNPSASTIVQLNLASPNTPPTISLTGVVDGATLVTNSGGVYHGLTVTAIGNAAPGNTLTQLTIWFGNSSLQWNLTGNSSVNQPWMLPDLAPGIYTIYAILTDNNNHSMSTSPIRFIVNTTSAVAPSITMTAPTNGATLVAPGPFALTATVTPAGAAISSVRYYAGTTVIGSGTTDPFSAQWNNPAAGSYSLIALATDVAGAMKLSAPISVTVTSPPPPTVSLTSPVSGSGYYTTDLIPFAASATGNGGATIAKVEFYADGLLLGASGTLPYQYSWTTATAGTHSIYAIAYDSRNLTTTSNSVSITVTVSPNPTVSITSPANGASFGSPASIPISVNAAAGMGAKVTRVDFYSGTDLVASSSTAPWGVTWNNVGPGTYSLTAVVTDSNAATGTSGAVAVTISLGQPQIVLDAGLDGATVNDAVVLISGTVQAPPNSGISVNGFVGNITGDGHFFINDVPLQPGVNSLPVTLATQDGATATQTITITLANDAAFSVNVDHDSGIAPLDVTFSVESLGNSVAATVEFDFDGDGAVDYTATGLTGANPTVTFGNPGYNRATVRFKDASGNVLYTATKAIYVYSATDHFNMLKGIYKQMLDRLRATNINDALTALTNDASGKFQPIFTSLGANLVTIVDQLGTIDHATVTSTFAEIVLTRNEGGQTYAYSIHLVRAPDGIWRIDGM